MAVSRRLALAADTRMATDLFDGTGPSGLQRLSARRVVLTALLTILFASFFLFVATDLVPDRALLVIRGAETFGTVRHVEIARRQYVSYEFSVGDANYAGTALDSGTGNPPLESLKAGEAVRVVYDPEDPNRSTAGEPLQHFLKDLASVVAASAIFAALTAWALRLAER